MGQGGGRVSGSDGSVVTSASYLEPGQGLNLPCVPQVNLEDRLAWGLGVLVSAWDGGRAPDPAYHTGVC